MGYQDFSPGDVLTAAHVDNIIRQTQMWFNTTTARDSALSGVLASGMRAWTASTPAQTEWLYNGSQWEIVSEPHQTWTPTLSQGVTVAHALSYGWYYRSRGTFWASASMLCSASGTALNSIVVSTPFTLPSVEAVGGDMLVADSSGNTYHGYVKAPNTTALAGYGESGTVAAMGQAPAVQLTSGARVSVTLTGRVY